MQKFIPWRRHVAGLLVGLFAAGSAVPAQADDIWSYMLAKVTGQNYGAAFEVPARTAVQSTTRIDASVTDTQGNTYVAGTFKPSGSVAARLTIGHNLDGYETSFYSTADGIAYVVKYDQERRVVWAMNFDTPAFAGSTANYTITDITVGSGNAPDVYLTGQLTAATMKVHPVPTSAVPQLTRKGTIDSFLVRLDGATGNPALAANYGGAGASLKADAVAYDGQGAAVYLAGSLAGAAIGNVSPALTVPFSGTSAEDGFLLKVVADGSFADAANFGGGAAVAATIAAVEVDADGNVFAAGTMSGALTAPAAGMLGALDAFVVKYNPSFAYQWLVNYGSGTTSRLTATALAVDASSIYVAGTMEAAVTLPGLGAPTALVGTQAGLVFKASAATGAASWATPIGGTSVTTARPRALAVDGEGEVFVGMNFAGGPLTAPPAPNNATGVGQQVTLMTLSSTGQIRSVAEIKQDATEIVLGRGRGIGTNRLFALAGSIDGDLAKPAVTKTPDSVTDALVLRTLPNVILTVAVDGPGWIRANRGGVDCPDACVSTGIMQETLVTLTAIPDTGARFGGWTGTGCTGDTDRLTLTLARNTTCTATFARIIETPANLPPPPPPAFVTAPPPMIENVSTIGSGSGSTSFASSFANPAGLTFSAAPPAGGSLPDWITFDPATVSFSYSVPLPADLPIQPLSTAGDRRAGRADARANWPNTVYPPLLRVAQLPVVLTAIDKVTGQSFASTIQMSFHAPRSPVAIAAVSLSLDRALGNKASGRSALSHDGGQMVFETQATNLFPQSASSYGDIVRYHAFSGTRDRLTQTAIPGGGVANSVDGISSSPAVSADGAYGAFASDGPGVSGTPSGGRRQVYRTALGYPRVPLNEAATPAALMVSATAAGVAGNGRSDNPSLSRDGRHVAIDSDATNFAADLDGSRRVWRKDLVTGDLVQVGPGANPSISWDGSVVAYEQGGQIMVRDMLRGTVRNVAAGSAARLSARGDSVAFVQGTAVVLADLAAGATRTVGQGDQPALSADGRFVAFRAVGADGNGFTQIWLHDVERGVTALVTQTSSGAGGNGDSLYPSLSGDGTQVGFVSAATDLVNGSPKGAQAYVAANPLPLPEKTGYWYMASANNGQGWLMERWGNRAFIGGLVYDAAGQASWLGGSCRLSGLNCTGTLVSHSGGTAFGAATGPSPVAGPGVGVTLTTAEDGRSTVLKVGDAAPQTLTMFPIGGTATTGFAGLPQAGWWIEEGSTGGNGYFIAVDTQAQADGSVRHVAYVSVLTFEVSGRPVWYSAQATLGADLGFSGLLMQYGTASGAAAVGQLRIAFTGNDTARINLPNGRTAGIGRFRF